MQHLDDLLAHLHPDNHPRATALKAQAEAAGFDWSKLIDLVRQYGPLGLDLIEKFLAAKQKPA